MTSPQKRKGDAFERQVRDWLLADGWPLVARIPAGATQDIGDFLLPADCPMTLDAKAHRTLRLPEWVRRSEEQAQNAGRVAGFVVCKQFGTSDVGESLVVSNLRQLSALVHRLRGIR